MSLLSAEAVTAVGQFVRDEVITQMCPKCGRQIHVSQVDLSIYVSCDLGCTNAHIKMPQKAGSPASAP